MNEASAHPNIDQLVAFSRGNLADTERIAIEQHIQNCESCCEAIASVPDDTWIGRMRQAETAFAGRQKDSTHDLSRVFDEHPRYRLVKKLGEGGMGEVYLAQHRLMERLVAVKVIRSQLVSNADAVARFRQEVKAAARLSHRGIVTAHDAEEAGGLHFLVMEYVEGTSLDEAVAHHGRLPVMHACNYTRQAAVALQHAHEHGMVHRDIKPQNLMLAKRPNGLVKILDFGLTRIADQPECHVGEADAAASAGLTAAGATVGTPDYMAPEQVQDASRADIRSDIYSLGCTLYFLLSGRPPFPAGTLVEKLSDQMRSEPTPLERLREDLPKEVAAIVRKMMAKDPARRFQSPADVAAALEPHAKPQERSGPPPPPVIESATTPWARISRSLTPQHKSIATKIFLVMLALSFGAAALLSVLGERRVLVILPPEDVAMDEYGPVRGALEKSGIRVETASTRREVRSADGTVIDADLLLGEVDPTSFEAVVFVGGAMWDYYGGPNAERVQDIIGSMTADGKHIAAIGVGQKALAAAGAYRGRRVAYLPDVESVAPNSGADWVHEPVVVSGNLITARESRHSIRFANTLIEALGGRP